MTIIHDFRASLNGSKTLVHEAAWVAFYRRLWPQAQYILRCDDDGPWQRWGVDRRVTLPGRDILIDEKVRDTAWTEILLEEWSVYYGPRDRRNRVGWSLDDTKRCDFVAYAIPKRGCCYLLPFELLRLAYLQHRAEWHRNDGQDGREKWYPLVAPNDGYVTINCAVPWQTLRHALVEQIYRTFGDVADLPEPVIGPGGELVFTHPDG